MDTRRATRQDLPQIRTLLDAEGLPPLPSSLPLSNLVVALDGSAVQGVVGLEVIARYGIVRVLVVSRQHRRKQIGASLVRSIVARSHELGLRELYATTADASGFLERQAFESVAPALLPGEVRSRLGAGSGATTLRLSLETRW